MKKRILHPWKTTDAAYSKDKLAYGCCPGAYTKIKIEKCKCGYLQFNMCQTCADSIEMELWCPRCHDECHCKPDWEPEVVKITPELKILEEPFYLLCELN
jgi:hypothetical protein